MAMFDTRQFGRQGLTASAFAWRLRAGMAFEFFFDGCQIHVDRFFKQIALLAGQHFAGLAVTDPPQIRQLVRQPADLGLLLLDQCPHLRKHGRIDVSPGKLVE